MFTFWTLMVRGVAGAQADAGVLTDLDNNVSKWALYVDPPGNRICSTLEAFAGPTPSGDGKGLRFSSDACTNATPYTGLHVYENVSFVDANAFVLALSFQFSAGTNQVQALEFTQNKWDGTHRFEFAVQMEMVGDGGPDQGKPPTWRLWEGSRWRAFNYNQKLAPEAWHTLRLFGDIVDGRVHYRELVSDGVTFTLGQSYAPVPDSAPPKCAVGLQLDGDRFMSPHQVLVDGVNFQWFPIITAPSLDRGMMTFRFFVPNGATCFVERSQDLTQAQWVTVTNLIGTGSEMLFREPADQPERFYRLASP